MNFSDPCSLAAPGGEEEEELQCGMRAKLKCGDRTCLK